MWVIVLVVCNLGILDITWKWPSWNGHSLRILFFLCWLSDHFGDCCLIGSVNHTLVHSFWHNSLPVGESQIKSPECRELLMADGQNQQDLQVKQEEKQDFQIFSTMGRKRYFHYFLKRMLLFFFFKYINSRDDIEITIFIESTLCWESLKDALIYWGWSQTDLEFNCCSSEGTNKGKASSQLISGNVSLYAEVPRKTYWPWRH